MNVFYYYYFLFYTRIIPDDEPHATVVFTLSFTQALVVNGIFQAIIVHSYCNDLEPWQMISVLVVIIVINYLVFFRTGKGKEIVNARPKFFNSRVLSILIVAVCALGSVSLMFWGPIYLKSVLDQCKKCV